MPFGFIIRRIRVGNTRRGLKRHAESQVRKRIVAHPQVRHGHHRPTWKIKCQRRIRHAEQFRFRAHAVSHEETHSDIRRRREPKVSHCGYDRRFHARDDIANAKGKVFH